MILPPNTDEIAPGLFQGGAPAYPRLLKRMGFDVVVLCAREHQPPADAFPGCHVIFAPNDDDDRPMTLTEARRALEAARAVAHQISIGKTVLVTCAAGWNRSGLVSALALHYLTGRPGTECVAIVRARRKNALRNDHFVAHLLRLPRRRPQLEEYTA